MSYIQKYKKAFGYGEQDRILCENCGKVANHVHHIEFKGMGGSKNRDNIENLIALCREPCHQNAHGADWVYWRNKFKEIVYRRSNK